MRCGFLPVGFLYPYCSLALLQGQGHDGQGHDGVGRAFEAERGRYGL